MHFFNYIPSNSAFWKNSNTKNYSKSKQITYFRLSMPLESIPGYLDGR